MKLIINSALLLGLVHSAASQCAPQILIALAEADGDYTLLAAAVATAGLAGALVGPLSKLRIWHIHLIQNYHYPVPPILTFLLPPLHSYSSFGPQRCRLFGH
jgi:hypothetical protein